MPKLKNVTDEDVLSAKSDAGDLIDKLHDLNERIGKMNCDKIENPLDAARLFNILTRLSASFVTLMLTTQQMQEQRAEVDRLRAKLKDNG